MRKKLQFLLAITSLFISSFVLATPPVNLFYEPVVLHDIRGINPFYSHTDVRGCDINFVPFYRNSSSAWNCEGNKVPEGDRLGTWNMLGLIQGTCGSPYSGNGFDPNTQPTLFKAKEALSNLECENQSSQDLTQNSYSGADTIGRVSVPIDEEAFGLRGRFHINFGGGVNFAARGGFQRYKQKPKFNPLSCDEEPLCPYDFTACQRDAVIEHLLKRDVMRQAFEEVCIDVSPICRTVLEDTHLSLSWMGSFSFRDKSEEPVVFMKPYFEVGAWLPTGAKSSQNKPFVLPMGNDGHWAVTGEAALTFNFPKTIELGGGISATFPINKVTRDFRMPSSPNQSGIYPFKVKAEREAGITWAFHGEMAAYNIIDRLSFYFNYIATRHEEDKYEIKKDCDECEKQECGTEQCEPKKEQECFTCPVNLCPPDCCFLPEKLQEESCWESQKLYFGFEYFVTDDLAFGAGFLAPIQGKNVYKSCTLMASLKLALF